MHFQEMRGEIPEGVMKMVQNKTWRDPTEEFLKMSKLSNYFGLLNTDPSDLLWICKSL
jgi:hypothetical protein